MLSVQLESVLQLIIKDLKSQERIVGRLNGAVDDMVAQSGEAACRPLREKRDEMNEYFRNVRLTARDKHNQLQDVLKEACLPILQNTFLHDKL